MGALPRQLPGGRHGARSRGGTCTLRAEPRGHSAPTPPSPRSARHTTNPPHESAVAKVTAPSPPPEVGWGRAQRAPARPAGPACTASAITRAACAKRCGRPGEARSGPPSPAAGGGRKGGGRREGERSTGRERSAGGESRTHREAARYGSRGGAAAGAHARRPGTGWGAAQGARGAGAQAPRRPLRAGQECGQGEGRRMRRAGNPSHTQNGGRETLAWGFSNCPVRYLLPCLTALTVKNFSQLCRVIGRCVIQ